MMPGDDAVLYGRAAVRRIDKVAPEICRVTFRPSTPLYYRVGQFINIRRPDGLVRSYSLASVPRLDKDLEIHVKRLPRGQMSNWLFADVGPGDGLDLQGPNGDCFYVPGTPDQNLLLIGTGTGLAPLMGVVRDALDGEHTGGVHLYHGSREPDGLNMVDALRALAKYHGNLHYVPCVSGDDVPAGCRAGRADVAAFGDHPDLKGWRAFICGYPAMVREARKTALMAGIPIPHIHADPFDFKDLRSVEREGEMARPDGW
jgi:ferredoxin-NADP reductase